MVEVAVAVLATVIAPEEFCPTSEEVAISLMPTPQEFQDVARAAGFVIEQAQDTTGKVYESARRISQIATPVLRPLSWVSRVPLLGALVKPFGFESPKHAARFVDACQSQVKVFDEGLGAYYIHVFRKPA